MTDIGYINRLSSAFMHLQRGFGSIESGNLQAAEGLPWRNLQSGVEHPRQH